MINRILTNTQNKKITSVRIDPNRDFYFFPYVITSGASDIDQKLKFNALHYKRIFTGLKALIVKPLGWETELTPGYLNDADEWVDVNPTDKDELKKAISLRHLRKGFYSVGFVADPVVYQNQYETDETGFVFNNIITSITVYFKDTQVDAQNDPGLLNIIWDFKSNTIKKNYQNLFFTCPELNSSDLLYIESLEVTTNPQNGDYLFHKVQFKSLGDTINKTGRAIAQAVQFGAPGEDFLFPRVIIQQRDPEKNEDGNIKLDKDNRPISTGVKITKHVPKTQEELKNHIIKQKGIKSVQIEHDGAVALLSIDVIGREKHTNPLIVNKSNSLWFDDFKSPKFDPLEKTYVSEDKHVLLPSCHFSLISFSKNWKVDQGLIWDPNITRENRGSLMLNNFDIVRNTTSDFKKLYEYQNITLAGGWRLAFHPEFSKTTIFSTEGGDVADADRNQDYLLKNGALCDVLNLMKYLNRGLNTLNPYIVQMWNTKNQTLDLIKSGTSLLGTLVGFSKGGCIEGDFIGQMIGGIVGELGDKIISASWFEKNQIFAEGGDSFPVIMSQTLFEMLSANLPVDGDNKLRFGIPITLLTTDQNPASSIVDSSQIRDKFHLSLTDEVTDIEHNIHNVRDIKKDDGIRIDTDELFATPTTKTFIVDLINLKEIGARNVAISFYDEDGEVVSYFKTENQANYSDNMFEVDTLIVFNDYNGDHFNSEEYKGYDLTPKTPVVDKSSLSKKELAEAIKVIEARQLASYKTFETRLDTDYTKPTQLENIETEINQLNIPNDISEDLKKQLEVDLITKYKLRQTALFEDLKNEILRHYSEFNYLVLLERKIIAFKPVVDVGLGYKSTLTELQKNELEDTVHWYKNFNKMKAADDETVKLSIGVLNSQIDSATNYETEGTAKSIKTVIRDIKALQASDDTKITEEILTDILNSAESKQRTLIFEDNHTLISQLRLLISNKAHVYNSIRVVFIKKVNSVVKSLENPRNTSTTLITSELGYFKNNYNTLNIDDSQIQLNNFSTKLMRLVSDGILTKNQTDALAHDLDFENQKLIFITIVANYEALKTQTEAKISAHPARVRVLIAEDVKNEETRIKNITQLNFFNDLGLGGWWQVLKRLVGVFQSSAPFVVDEDKESQSGIKGVYYSSDSSPNRNTALRTNDDYSSWTSGYYEHWVQLLPVQYQEDNGNIKLYNSRREHTQSNINFYTIPYKYPANWQKYKMTIIFKWQLQRNINVFKSRYSTFDESISVSGTLGVWKTIQKTTSNKWSNTEYQSVQFRIKVDEINHRFYISLANILLIAVNGDLGNEYYSPEIYITQAKFTRKATG